MADGEATGTALVLEGGGFRGMFTAGVLDVLQEAGIYGFDSVWGVSAGAINAVSFMTHQTGRYLRTVLAFRDDWRFMSLRSLVTTGDIAGADFLYHEIETRLDPADERVFNENPTRFYAVATDVVLGTAAYLPVTRLPDDVEMVRASASLPALSQLVEIDGHRYLDGGTADSIPFEAALGLSDAARDVVGYRPARRALVVLTRERTYVKSDDSERLALRSHRYDAYPYYLRTLSTRRDRYDASRARLWEEEGGIDGRDGRVLVVCPDEPVDLAVVEHDGGRLLALYLRGRREAERRLEDIRRFVGTGD